MKPTRCVTTSTAMEPARLESRRWKRGRRSISRISPSREMRSRRFWSASRRSRQPEWRRRPGLPSRLPIRSAALRWWPSQPRRLPPAQLTRAPGRPSPVPRCPPPRHRFQPRLLLLWRLPLLALRLPLRRLQLPPLQHRDGSFPFHDRQRPTLSSSRRSPAGQPPGPWWPSRRWPQRPLQRRLSIHRPSRPSSNRRLRRPTPPQPPPPWKPPSQSPRRPLLLSRRRTPPLPCLPPPLPQWRLLFRYNGAW